MYSHFNTAIHSAVSAGKKIMDIYEHGNFEIDHKSDASPLTVADKASNEIIVHALQPLGFPYISEESKLMSYNDRATWGNYWLIDPLDGTKEFINKNGEFTVNIAFCEGSSPVFGIIYVPVTKELYIADVKAKAAYKLVLNTALEIPEELKKDANRIRPTADNLNLIRVVGSRSHMNQDTQNYIDSLKKLYKEVEIVSKGSSLKFCLVAEGKADVYPRFAPTMEWDTAAGQAICEAVGLQVISQTTNEAMSYNKENLLNPYFLVSKK